MPSLELKNYLPGGLALAYLGVTLALPPIPVPPAYHQFADQQTILGLPHFGDLVSNLVFLVAGLTGLAGMKEARERWFKEAGGGAGLYLIYFACVTFSAAGSAYYHWAPDDAALFWDRLLFAIFIKERMEMDMRLAFPVLLLLGLGALLHWRWSLDGQGGDQRFYLLVQIIPIAVIPALCLLFQGRATHGRYVAYMFALYGLAKLTELLDREVMDFMGGVISGHSVKHLLAAWAAYMVVAMPRRA